jgi:tetratricopeptide (TPR) repeat protein
MAVALKKMGRLAMAETEFRRLLRRPEESYPISLRVRALLQLSFIYRELGDLYLASVIARECHMRAVDGADEETVAAALNTAGIIEEEQQHHQQAVEHFRAALDVLREGEERDLMRLTVQVNLGGGLVAIGRFRAGVALLKQALERSRELGFRRPQALALTKLGNAHMQREQIGIGREFLRQSDEVAERGEESYQDILFINAFLNWQLAREAGRATQERIFFGRLKYLRSQLESRFPEVDAFDAVVRGEKRYA